jgi:GT2 family glycosyltransferase
VSTHVAVCIVGFRNPGDVARCLRALEASTWTDFEVVICENGGADAFAALVDAIPPRLAGGQGVMTMSAEDNPGFAGGVNLCLSRASSADAWWILNPDTEPHPGALAALVARLERGDCQAVGGKLHWPDGRIQAYGGRWRPWLARAVSLGMGEPLEADVDAAWVERAQTYLNGASMLIGPRFLRTVGPMREDYFLYGEEVEWCLRGRALGMRLGFAPDAKVLHGHGATTGAGLPKTRQPRLPIYLGERNKMLLTRDRFAARLLVAASAALILLSLRYLREGAWRQFGYALAGWWAGLLGRRGPTDVAM